MQKGDKQRESIDDDLEDFYRDLKDGKISESSSNTYFLPLFTEEEQKLVEKEFIDDSDDDLEDFYRDLNGLNYFKEKKIRKPKKTESMFVRGQAWRITSIIDPSFTQNCCSIQ